MNEPILTSCEGGILRLTFNRPDKKNAITAAMYATLADGLEKAQEDSAIRVVLFDSVGDVFTSGNDIADFMANDTSVTGSGEIPPVFRFLMGLAKATKPLISAVQGPAVGVGVTMLLHCDLVYASEKAAFKTPFVDLALVPEAASSLLLPRIAGHQRASEMLLAGKKIDAARAREFGFVNEVVSHESLAQVAGDAAADLAAKAPTSLQLSKKLMKGDISQVLTRMEEEGKLFNERLQSADFREAGMAFMQKRKPDFSNAQ